jgi:hypothetical protein
VPVAQVLFCPPGDPSFSNPYSPAIAFRPIFALHFFFSSPEQSLAPGKLILNHLYLVGHLENT